MTLLARRILLIGGLAALPGCATISALEGAARPLPTYELAPTPGRKGPARAITLVVTRPDAPAAIATDRILVKPDPLAVTYLPDAHWADEVPALLQSLAIRSIAGTGRLGHVGTPEGGPVPDVALLLRIDAFQAEPVSGSTDLPVRIAIAATLLQDRDQSVIATRDFAGAAVASSEAPSDIIPAFQRAIDAVLPPLSDWTAERARSE